jgi:hypothetical protein
MLTREDGLVKDRDKTVLARRFVEALGLPVDVIAKLCDNASPDQLRLAADTIRTIAGSETDLFRRGIDPKVVPGRALNLLRGEGIICNADLALRTVIELRDVRHFNTGSVNTLLVYLETRGMRPRLEHELPIDRLQMMFPDIREAPVSCLVAFGAGAAGVRTLIEAKILRISQLISLTEAGLIEYLKPKYLPISPAEFPEILKGLHALGLSLTLA